MPGTEREHQPGPGWRIVVLDDHAPSRTLLGATVARVGGAVVAEADTAATGIELVERLRPDAVVLAVGLPDRDGLDVAAEIMQRARCPIVVLTSHGGREVVRQASAAGVMAYLLKPIRAAEVEPAIGLAIARFAELTRASHEAAALRRALADRKVIERAKGLVMQHLRLSEAEAFRMLRKTAMDRRTSIAAVADAVVTSQGGGDWR
jgi:two-component system, response regulator PdtaR